MVTKTGIFWFVDGEMVWDFEDIEHTEDDVYINYPYSHFEMWDKLKRKGMVGDFAKYPRGRVIYDNISEKYKIYADTCITEEQIREVVSLMEIEAYFWKIYEDEHYSCEKCVNEHGIDWGDEGANLKETLENTNENKLMVNILRGENELTGNLIEISNGDAIILLECGKSLDNDTNKLEEIEKSILTKPYNAVIISHGHIDHYGLIDKVKKDIPIYMGGLTKKLYNIANSDKNLTNIVCYKDGECFKIGSGECAIDVTPYLCDHSAPDSYMLLFEHGENKILYTGDFRSHGRKSFYNLLKRLPEKIDTLIIEGTNEAIKQVPMSEKTLQTKLSNIMENSDKPVFLLTPTTNIDRIVSAYKASARNKRNFIVDSYQGKILEAVGGGVPRPTTFKSVKVYYPMKIKKKDMDTFVDFSKSNISISDLIQNDNKYTMLVRTSMTRYITNIDRERKKLNKVGLAGSTLIYSMWTGYKEKENTAAFLSAMEGIGVNIITLHTSGHADTKAIKQLQNRVNADKVIKVHSPVDKRR